MRVCIVGPLPEPLGGVSTFVQRLASRLTDRVSTIIDLHPHAVKVRPPRNVPHLIGPRNRLWRLVWMIGILLRLEETIHFNFSMPGAVALLCLLPKRKNRWILTLHHGDLEGSFQFLSAVTKMLVKRGLRRIDTIVALSDTQSDFYERNAPRIETVAARSYIAPQLANIGYPRDLPREFTALRERCSKIICCSGFPLGYYRHDWVLKAVNLLQQDRPDLGVVLCLYGPDREGIKGRLISQFQSAKNAIVLVGLDPRLFEGLLASIDVYARPTLKDSFGIASADALLMGAQVVASDICPRAPGVHIFRSGDFQDFLEKLALTLEREKLEPSLRFVESIDSAKFYDDLYGDQV